MKYKVIFTFFIFIFLSLLSPSLTIAKIVFAQGEACHSDIRKAKEMALKKAKQNAVEKYIGVLIDTKTLVIKGKLVRDIMQMRALGMIRLVEDPIYENFTLVKKADVVCTKVKAKFEIFEKNIKPADFGLVLLFNKKEFKSGEELEIELSSETPCYPYLFNVDTSGKVFRLFPNPLQETFLLKGKLKFPTKLMKSRGYKLIIIPAEDMEFPQTEEIVFLCTKKKVIALEKYFPCAFAQDEEELYKVLKMSYPISVEKFNEILLQIGVDNYDIVDDVYKIVK